MTAFEISADEPRIREVASFRELLTTPFIDGVNALCWTRKLPGDFGELARLMRSGPGVTTLKEDVHSQLPLSAEGRVALHVMLEDARLLREQGLAPELNCVRGYARDDRFGPISADVYSFHVDRAQVETDTWLCTYFGPASEGLRNDEAQRHVDIPATRAELLQQYGGADDETFRDHLEVHSYDLHYAPLANACPFLFGLGNLWRVAVDWPESRVPPCIHRAPPAAQDSSARLLLIS